jgi:AcrR family transcriptional regulator
VTGWTRSRRAAILEAALDRFSADGYDAASIEGICAASGASVGSVYHHFGSKEGIAAALYAEGIAAYQAPLLAILDAGGEPGPVAAALARHHLSWVRDNPAWARYLLHRGHAPARVTALPEVRQHNERLLRRLAEWAGPQVAAGRLVDVPPLVLLALVLGPAHAVARAALSGDGPLDGGVSGQVAAAAARSIRPDGPDPGR